MEAKKYVKVLWIKAHPRYAYHSGEKGIITSDKAEELLNGGYIIPVPDQDDREENPLPEDFPARDILFKAGFTDIEKIKDAGESLLDIKGIGKSTLKLIASYKSK